MSRRDFIINAAKIAGGVVAAGSLVELAAACGGSAAPLEGQGPFDVFIYRGKFLPQKITIKLNQTVTWTNKDNNTYTIVSDAGLFKQTLAPGGTFQFTFNEHNNHRYHSLARPSVKGVVFVEQDPTANCNDCHG